MPILKRNSSNQYLISNIRELEKEEQTKSKTSRMNEIIKMRVKINEIETEKQ